MGGQLVTCSIQRQQPPGSQRLSPAKELNRQFLASSPEEADFVVLDHCITYAYHILRADPGLLMVYPL